MTESLLNAPTNLKDFIHSYFKQKDIFDLQQRHDAILLNTNKNFFSDNYTMDIFVFISAIISLLTILTAYLLCKHKKIKALIASLVLHQVKEVGAISGSTRETYSECTTLSYIGITLTILSLLLIVTFLHKRKTKFCRVHRFSHAVKSMIFISDVQKYVPSNYVKQQVYSFISNYRYAESQKCKIN